MSKSRSTLWRLAHAESENLIHDDDLDCSQSEVFATAIDCFSYCRCTCEFSSSNNCLLCAGDAVSDNQAMPASVDYGDSFYTYGWRWRVSDSESDDENADIESVDRLEQALGVSTVT